MEDTPINLDSLPVDDNVNSIFNQHFQVDISTPPGALLEALGSTLAHNLRMQNRFIRFYTALSVINTLIILICPALIMIQEAPFTNELRRLLASIVIVTKAFDRSLQLESRIVRRSQTRSALQVIQVEFTFLEIEFKTNSATPNLTTRIQDLWTRMNTLNVHGQVSPAPSILKK